VDVVLAEAAEHDALNENTTQAERQLIEAAFPGCNSHCRFVKYIRSSKRAKGQTVEYAIDAAAPERFAVQCRGVMKTYGTGDARVTALSGIDLEVRRGELLMVVGPSGCGKTTLISVIAGILDQDSGQCEVLGHDLKNMDQRERARFRGLSIGFVFQLFNLLPALNAAENVSVPLLINGIARKNAEARAEEVLEAVSLGSRLDALPGKLSGGQQQRVAIARALVHEPKLIVCDEPTSNLDHVTGRSMMELLRGVARRPDRALIVVTHDPRIFEFADRIARMDDGKIVEVVGGSNKERLQ
jgi:putative ABC transport system ATP-binding protein